jgi:hypothetical protein
MSNDFLKFIQFTKLEDTGEGPVIWGIATHEKPDLDNEVCSYADAVPVYQTWSEAAKARTEKAGQEESLGNIRLQHSLDIGGKATKLDYNEPEKAIYLGSRPLNDQIHADLKAGFYTGYSQGGSYAWRKCSDCDRSLTLQQANNWCPTCKKNVVVNYGLKRLAEVSYVDSPCSGVGFEYVKADGSKAAIKFSRRSEPMELTKAQLEQIAAHLAKADAKTKRVAGEDLTHEAFAYVGDTDKTDTWKLPIKFSTEAKTKRHIRNVLARFEQTKGIPADKKEEVKAKIVAAAKEHGIDVKEEQDKAAQAHEDLLTKIKAIVDQKAEAKGLKKGLYEVSRLAEILQGLAWMYESALWEREVEGDDSTVPDELKDLLESMIDTFIAMAEEEAKELAARSTGKSATGEKTMTQEELDALNKAAKKSLASHFAKSAAHHEKLAAAHEAEAESHDKMCDAHKACKADVGSGAKDEAGESVLANQQAFHKAGAEHHSAMAKSARKCAKAHSSMAEHLHKMSEDHDAEEHEKTVKAIKAETPAEDAPIVKVAPAVAPGSIDADVAAEAERQRNGEEYKSAVSSIAKARLDAELAALKAQTIIPDGVKLIDAAPGTHVVARSDEQFKLAGVSSSVSGAGI